jgi:diaminopimelate decarboxylase
VPRSFNASLRHHLTQDAARAPLPEHDAFAGLTWQALGDLAAEFGDAFFLLDVSRFERNYDTFLNAFRSWYAPTNIAYSYKTNYLPRLCERIDRLGGYAEVVSGMEYELAVRVGVAPSRIIFNGPYKRPDELERALLGGATVNVDSSAEAHLVAAIARRSPGHQLNLGLRCTFDIGTPLSSRFGLDVDNGALAGVFDMLAGLENCRIRGLHCHFSTGERTVESFRRRTRRLLELSSRHFQAHGPQFLNVGGGFFSNLPGDMRAQFTCDVPTFGSYAEAIARQFADAFPNAPRPELIVEPGTALTADVMTFAATVIAVKRVGSRSVAVTSGSIHNIKPTLHGLTLPMRVLSQPDPRDQVRGPVDIVGCTCMEHDCLYAAYPGLLATGDYVVFDNVGAYTIVMKPPFIHPSPAVIAYDSTTNAVDLAKRRETFADVFATYDFKAAVARTCSADPAHAPADA